MFNVIDVLNNKYSGYGFEEETDALFYAEQVIIKEKQNKEKKFFVVIESNEQVIKSFIGNTKDIKLKSILNSK